MEGPNHAFVRRIRRELRAAADPTKSGPMQSYMKSEMPFYGVPTPVHRKLCRDLLRARRFEDAGEWRDTVLALWRGARYREERYCAIHLAGHRNHCGFRNWGALPIWEEIIVTGAWWDYVDSVSRFLAELLESTPRAMTRRMQVWSRSENLWKRRSSIICQLGRKENTDLDLLYANILENVGDGEFFIRKAIGWALREYAWTDPGEIERFVRAHGSELAPLSRREALKNIGANRG